MCGHLCPAGDRQSRHTSAATLKIVSRFVAVNVIAVLRMYRSTEHQQLAARLQGQSCGLADKWDIFVNGTSGLRGRDCSRNRSVGLLLPVLHLQEAFL